MKAHQEDIDKARKIRDSFLCLRKLMLDPGKKTNMDSISTNDFPLPNIAVIKTQWNSYTELRA